jgi:hypothetical protein
VLAANGLKVTPDPVAYLEACDGSAAIALSPDTFVVAHDDDNILRGYRTGTAAPIFSEALGTFLGAKKEVDIEGAARIGDLIYWIGSHARDSKGNFEPTRLRFFATRVTTAGGQVTVKPEGKAYDKLLETLIQPLLDGKGLGNASKLAAEKPDGLNVEGLAAAGDHLLIAFRNPLPGGKAIVAELTNPAQLIKDSPSKPALGKVFELDLEGRGIRSIELVSESKGYLLVAGPFDGGDSFPASKPRFALYRWPSLGAAPQRLDVSFPTDFGPEALYQVPSAGAATASTSTTWAFLSDDGDRMIGADTCKKAPEKTRRFHRATITVD